MNLYGFFTNYDSKTKTLLNSHNSIFIASPNTFDQKIDASFIYDYEFFTLKWSNFLKNRFEEAKYTSDIKFFLDFNYLLQEFGAEIKYNKILDSSLIFKSKTSKNPEICSSLYYKITFKYYEKLNINFLLSYDPFLNKISEFSSQLNVYDFNFTFRLKDEFKLKYSYLIGDFVKVNDFTTLIPYEFNATYNKNFYRLELFNKKIGFDIGVNTGWSMKIQRFIDNELWLELNFKFRYAEFFEIWFSTRSSNKKTYKYFKAYTDKIGVKHVNFFKDIVDSFNFFSIEARKSSLFKIKKFSTGFSFNFYDWKILGQYSLIPELEQKSGGVRAYVFRNGFDISITWNFLTQLNSSFESKKDNQYELVINTLGNR